MAFLAAAWLLVPALRAADPVYERAWNKMDLIESGRAKPGSVIVLTPAELNAWARTRIPQMYDGIRDPRIELGTNTATAAAFVDFAKARHPEGASSRGILDRMIEGERPVKISVRIESSRGQAALRLTSVSISDVAVTGSVLDFFVSAVFQPMFPEAYLNERFELLDNIERIEARPSGVRVYIRQ
jgi:hypothetical protein